MNNEKSAAYVYVLISKKDNKRYIGSTSNLCHRLKEHDAGDVFSTKNRRPLILYAYQKCDNLIQARLIESKYKKSRGMYDRAIKNGIIKVIA